MKSTEAYTPQQNGIAERMNRTLMESAQSMMSHAHFPNQFWAEAVATAAYLHNRPPTTVLEEEKTPYEKWYDCTPNWASSLMKKDLTKYLHRCLSKKEREALFKEYSKPNVVVCAPPGVDKFMSDFLGKTSHSTQYRDTELTKIQTAILASI